MRADDSVTAVIQRSPREKAAAWVWTGPLGHLYGTVADIAVLWARWGVSRVRARVRR
jgi:hypothetical protein